MFCGFVALLDLRFFLEFGFFGGFWCFCFAFIMFDFLEFGGFDDFGTLLDFGAFEVFYCGLVSFGWVWRVFWVYFGCFTVFCCCLGNCGFWCYFGYFIVFCCYFDVFR